MKTSVLGLNENIAAALAYVFIFFSGILILIFERENKLVRFAALQSTIFFIIAMLVMAILGFLGRLFLVGWLFGIVGSILGFIIFLVWIFLIITAAKGRPMKLPILGDSCWEQIHK